MLQLGFRDLKGRQIGAVAAPILLVQGETDQVVEQGEAAALARVAREAGNDDVTVVTLEGVDHSFAGGEIAALDAVTAWLRRRV